MAKTRFPSWGRVLMRGVWLIFLFAALVAVEQQSASGQSTRPVDCARDFDCFIRHSRTCTLAKVVRAESIDFFGVQGSGTIQYELLGPQAGACRFRQQTLALRVKLEPGLRAQLKAKGQSDADIATLERTWFENLKAEGKDRMTCDFPPPRLAEVLASIREGSINLDSRDAQYCREGDMSASQSGAPTAASGGGTSTGGRAHIHLTSGSSFEVDRWWYEGDLLYYERFGGVISVSRSDVERIEK